MPFKSKAQQKYLFSKMPEVALEFAKKTPKESYKKLPKHLKNKKTKRKNDEEEYSK